MFPSGSFNNLAFTFRSMTLKLTVMCGTKPGSRFFPYQDWFFAGLVFQQSFAFMQQVNVVHDLVWFWVTKRERCQTQRKQTHPRLTPLRRVLPHCSLHGPVPWGRGSSPPNAGRGQASLRQVSAALLTRERVSAPSGTLPPGLATLHAPTCPSRLPGAPC